MLNKIVGDTDNCFTVLFCTACLHPFHHTLLIHQICSISIIPLLMSLPR